VSSPAPSADGMAGPPPVLCRPCGGQNGLLKNHKKVEGLGVNPEQGRKRIAPRHPKPKSQALLRYSAGAAAARTGS